MHLATKAWSWEQEEEGQQALTMALTPQQCAPQTFQRDSSLETCIRSSSQLFTRRRPIRSQRSTG